MNNRNCESLAEQAGAASSVSSSLAAQRIVVRETPYKSVLNRNGSGEYSLNCYTGCAHACVYCYARFMQRFHPHLEPWGAFVDVKVNAIEALRRQLRRAPPGNVFVSSACDGWQPLEAQWRLTRRCCELLLKHGFHLTIFTKSALVLRDLDLLAGPNVELSVTVTTLDERLRKLWEPRAAPVAERMRVLADARDAGLKTAVILGPVLPMLSDSEEDLVAMFTIAAELRVSAIWVDALNPRPRVWPAVAELLRRQFPHLHEPYRRVLFDPRVRQDYLRALRARVARAAETIRHSLPVKVCFDYR
jgi:DNA repair photolyase